MTFLFLKKCLTQAYRRWLPWNRASVLFELFAMGALCIYTMLQTAAAWWGAERLFCAERCMFGVFFHWVENVQLRVKLCTHDWNFLPSHPITVEEEQDRYDKDHAKVFLELGSIQLQLLNQMMVLPKMFPRPKSHEPTYTDGSVLFASLPQN